MRKAHQSTAGTPVATFEGYVDGEPLMKWQDRANMPQPGAKLYTEAPPLPATGIKAADVAALLNDLSRADVHSTGGISELCARASAVIQGLLAGLDVEQLS